MSIAICFGRFENMVIKEKLKPKYAVQFLSERRCFKEIDLVAETVNEVLSIVEINMGVPSCPP